MENLIFNFEVDTYKSANFKVEREYGTTPSGNQMAGRWVLRTCTGEYVDHDRYRQDLFERNNLRVV